jgi:hypothetical protein
MDLSGFWWIDTNADSVGDVGYADTTGDGRYDTAALDQNYDRYIEAYAYDTNADGTFDTIELDTDLDGYLDSTGWDIDGDLVPDQVMGPATGGQVVTMDPEAAILGPTVVGPSNASSPQAFVAGLVEFTNSPFEQQTITRIINSMDATGGIWTLPDIYRLW